eukprot:CAMPEP_0198263906 /NCGR_PEP_ID=MMETSP1447-20131203/13873_1 /TAXON_ID=420782 /ORGANISM="Chaetoceros dichaeta, Strain CCMP1751" /LENGTH=63 /DNA_ID=CAMNT_0043952671 /DNA_START=322 /DNA_END=509 /DNA_ORIENTATION=-
MNDDTINIWDAFSSFPTAEPANPPIMLAIPSYPTLYSIAVMMESDIAWNPKQMMHLNIASGVG